MMLYHNMNSDHKRVARNILVEQAKNDPKSTNSTTDNLTNRTKKKCGEHEQTQMDKAC